MTSNEFMEWVEFLDWWDTEAFRREDYYLAQIAAEIGRSNAKNPRSVTVQKKLLKFCTKAKVQDFNQRVDHSKRAWMGMVGLDRNGKQLENVKRRRRRHAKPKPR